MRLFEFAIYLCTLTLTSCSFPQVPPIIWTDTELKVTTNFTKISLAFEIPQPCSQLANIQPLELQQSLNQWCLEHVDRVVLKPLEDLCRPTFVHPYYSHGIYNRSKRASDAEKQIERQILPQMEQLQQEVYNLKVFKNETEDSNASIRRRLGALEQADYYHNQTAGWILHRLDQLENRKLSLSTDIKDPLLIASELTLYFSNFKKDVEKAKDMWKQRTVSLQLKDFKFLKIIDRNKTLELGEANVLGCYVDVQGKGNVHFELSSPIVSIPLKILKANPFTFYQMDKGSNQGYTMEYTGPEYVVYNLTSQCIMPYSGGDDLVLFPKNGSECPPHNPGAHMKYWRKSCELMYYLDQTSIQVKQMETNLHIYCTGHSITVFKKRVDCPPYVFVIPRNESIEIHPNKREGIGIYPIVKGTKEKGSVELSTKITNTLMPNIAKVSMETVPLVQGCPGSQEKTVEPIWVTDGQQGGQGGEGRTAEMVTAGESKVSLYISGVALIISVVALGLVIYFRVNDSKNKGKERRQPAAQFMLEGRNVD